jgi:hypothetical protein
MPRHNVLTETGSIRYQVLLGLAPLPPVRPRPLHGNEGPNWKLTPARAAQREAAFPRLAAGRRAQAAALRAEQERRILAALAAGPLTTTELVRQTGIPRDCLSSGHRPRMLAAGQITVTRTTAPQGGPGAYRWALGQQPESAAQRPQT